MTSTTKAALYKTARLTPEAMELVPESMTYDGYVSVSFAFVAYNAMHKVDEIVYLCSTDGGIVGYFYERALCEFCL